MTAPCSRRGAVAITPDGTTAYVTRGYDDDDVTPIDVATRTPGARIPLPGFPDELVITPDGSAAYVVVSSVPGLRDDAVVPIDLATETVGTPIPVGPDIGGIAVPPAPPTGGPTSTERPAATPRFTG